MTLALAPTGLFGVLRARSNRCPHRFRKAQVKTAVWAKLDHSSDERCRDCDRHMDPAVRADMVEHLRYALFAPRSGSVVTGEHPWRDVGAQSRRLWFAAGQACHFKSLKFEKILKNTIHGRQVRPSYYRKIHKSRFVFYHLI